MYLNFSSFRNHHLSKSLFWEHLISAPPLSSSTSKIAMPPPKHVRGSRKWKWKKCFSRPLFFLGYESMSAVRALPYLALLPPARLIYKTTRSRIENVFFFITISPPPPKSGVDIYIYMPPDKTRLRIINTQLSITPHIFFYQIPSFDKISYMIWMRKLER